MEILLTFKIFQSSLMLFSFSLNKIENEDLLDTQLTD